MSSYIGRIHARDLFNFCVDVFLKIGVPREDADVVSENLVLANLRGVDSHGALIRLPHYLHDLKCGSIKLRPEVKLVKETINTGLIDGDNCLGPVAAMKATELAVKKGKAASVGLVGAKNINHVSMLAHYILKVVDKGFFGLASANSPPLVTPWGGTKPVFGTNPICIGFPVNKKKSIIIDMATSTVSAGKIASIAAKGERIPEGWALDKYGRPTTDPKVFLEGGMLLPFGGYKGYGLSLFIEAFAGILTGAPYSKYVRPGWATQGGFFIEAININAFRSHREYSRDMRDLVKLIKSCPPAKGFREILLPGEPESREYEKRSSDGIPVYAEPWNNLRKVSVNLNVKLPILTAE